MSPKSKSLKIMRYKYPKYWKDHLAQVAKNDHNLEGNQYFYFKKFGFFLINDNISL